MLRDIAVVSTFGAVWQLYVQKSGLCLFDLLKVMIN
jgi:hypothetical protein